MLAGAFGRRLIEHGLRGSITLFEQGVGNRILPREFHTPDPRPIAATQAQAITENFSRASLQAGARVLESSPGMPYGLAPSVTLSVRYPARFLKTKLRSLLSLFDRNRNRYEGMYLGIVDRHGKKVLEAANSTRVRGGTYWVRRDLDSCSPIEHSGLALAKPPPPCPA